MADWLIGNFVGNLIGKLGNGFRDNATTSRDTEKRMQPADSQRQIGLETTSGDVLIVV